MIYNLITEWSHRIVILFMLTTNLTTTWLFLPALLMLCLLSCSIPLGDEETSFFLQCPCAAHHKLMPCYMRWITSISHKRTYSDDSTMSCMNVEHKILFFVLEFVCLFSFQLLDMEEGSRGDSVSVETKKVQWILNSLLQCNYPKFLNLPFKSQIWYNCINLHSEAKNFDPRLVLIMKFWIIIIMKVQAQILGIWKKSKSPLLWENCLQQCLTKTIWLRKRGPMGLH